METFNVIFSTIKFLKSVAETFDLDVFLNQKLTPAEEALIATLDRWLIITVDELDTDVLQPISVKLALYATTETDPTTLWLKRTPQQFNKICLQRKTLTSVDLIPIYDYDAYIGSSALQTFQQTGTIPSALLTALGLDYPAISYWTPNNQVVGLQYLESSIQSPIDTSDVPYKVIWRILFRYFSVEAMMGSSPNL